jgi:hypothetical protein
MRIQEKMVRLLNEESWDDVRCNYPNSSSTTSLRQFFVAFKNYVDVIFILFLLIYFILLL